MRKAGDIINQYLREGKLAANRSEPIASGAYGTVYESDVPGRVMKQLHQPDFSGQLKQEANLQAIAADMGMAPRVTSLETFPAGIGDRIEMERISNNFEQHPSESAFYPGIPNNKDSVRISQQLGQMALKGLRLEDRHDKNIYYHKMTGRPMHIDFGMADIMDKSQSAAQLADVTAEGFDAAGLHGIGGVVRATVMDYLEGGDVDEAMDIAKQAFSRLQKIKEPLSKSVDLLG